MMPDACRRCLLIAVMAMAVSRVAAAEQSPSAAAFLKQVETQFSTWDTDDDGELSVAEIDAAVADPKTRGPAAAAVAAIKRAARSKRYTLPKLTTENLRALAVAKPAADRPDLPAMFAGGLARIEQSNRELFASGQPRLETIHQGRLGNCYCLAPLVAVLSVEPRRVTRMFDLETDGTIRVTLGLRTVRVAPVTDAELAQTAGNEQDGIWVNVYEKAVGEARNTDKPPAERLGSPIDAMARGGSAGTMLAYITGHKIQRFSCKFAHDESVSTDDREAIMRQLRDYLRQAVADRRPMTCGTEKTSTPGLTPNHAYAVLGYDAATDAIRLWNPHGSDFTPKEKAGLEHGYRRRDGVFNMPLVDFVQQFAGLAVETTVPVDEETELPKLP